MAAAWRLGDVDAYRGALARTDEVGPAVWVVMDLPTVAVNQLATVTGRPWEALLQDRVRLFQRRGADDWLR